MESPVQRRHDVAHCTVVGHIHYGLLIGSAAGESGFESGAEDGPRRCAGTDRPAGTRLSRGRTCLHGRRSHRDRLRDAEAVA
jgi:hypothetical protein